MLRMFVVFLVVFVGSFSSVQAKIIFVGSHGGFPAYVGCWNPFFTYDPLVMARSEGRDTAEKVADETTGGHGVDASIFFVDENYTDTIYPLISKDTANVSVGKEYVRQNYQVGDYVFLVGYSAGGKYVINLADELEGEDIPVHFLGMIDPVVGLNITISKNVETADVYIQRSDVMDYQGFPFFLYNSSKTEYHSYVVIGDKVNHFSIDNLEIVWSNLGGRMLSIAGVNTTQTVQLPAPDEFIISDDDLMIVDVSQDYGVPIGFEITPNPYTDSDDIHITHHHVRPYDEGSWHERVDTVLAPGGKFFFHTEARVENRSGHDEKNVDIDYCFTTRKDFDIDKDDRRRLDDDQVDIDAGEKENKTLRRSWVYIKPDLSTFTVETDDRHAFTLPITQDHIDEGKITLYFYIDVETEDGSDRDVSSEAKPDEFGKLVIWFDLPYANFTQSATSGVAPLTVNFTDLSVDEVISWNWDFGDGSHSSTSNPSHAYTSAGTFSVSLTVTGDGGQNTKIKTNLITVYPKPPRIVVVNPERTDRWRCEKDSQYKNIRWNRYDFPTRGDVAIYYTYLGSWRTLTSKTPNDGSYNWYMCKTKTKDTYGYVKVVSLNYSGVSGTSERFYIDHASGCD